LISGTFYYKAIYLEICWLRKVSVIFEILEASDILLIYSEGIAAI